MKREKTSVSIERKLRRRVEGVAREKGVSVSSLVNDALAAYLRKQGGGVTFVDPAFVRHGFRAKHPIDMGDLDAAAYEP
jgi:hypothetical protein